MIDKINKIEGVKASKGALIVEKVSPGERLPIVAIYGSSDNRFNKYTLLSGQYQKDEVIVGNSVYNQLNDKTQSSNSK